MRESYRKWKNTNDFFIAINNLKFDKSSLFCCNGYSINKLAEATWNRVNLMSASAVFVNKDTYDKYLKKIDSSVICKKFDNNHPCS